MKKKDLTAHIQNIETIQEEYKTISAKEKDMADEAIKEYYERQNSVLLDGWPAD